MTNTKPRLILAIACAIFLVFGMFNAGIGPVLNELAEQTGSTLAAVGAIFTFLFLGSLVAQVVAGPLTDRFGQKLILTISLFILSGGLIGFMNARSLPVMLALVFITGLGQGGVDLGANLVVSSAFPTNNTSVLNLLHFFFGLGAFFGPALVGLAIAQVNSGRIVHWFAAGAFLILAVVVSMIGGRKKSAQQTTHEPEKDASEGINVYLSPLLWIIGGLLLVYVGIEYGLGSWVTNYMNVTTSMAIQNGALVTSAYWGALTLGRLAGAAASRKISRIKLLSISLGASLLGSIGLMLCKGTTIPTIIFIVWIGLSYGTVYPTTVAVTTAAFPKNQGKAVGLITAMGSIGGLSLPWLAGVFLEKASPAVYLWFIILAITLMVALLYLMHRFSQVLMTNPK